MPRTARGSYSKPKSKPFNAALAKLLQNGGIFAKFTELAPGESFAKTTIDGKHNCFSLQDFCTCVEAPIMGKPVQDLRRVAVPIPLGR